MSDSRQAPNFPLLRSLFDLPATIASFPAIMVEGLVTNYGALWRRVSGFQRGIDALELGRRPRIAIVSEKSVDAYAVELACIAHGATFCPVNVEAPGFRNARILADFAPDAVYVGIRSFADNLVTAGIPKLGWKNGFSEVLFRDRDAHACAYVIYTSGTSGRPKGVKITYANLDWFLTEVMKRLEIPVGSRWSNHPNLAFDLSILDLFGSVFSRSTLVALSAGGERTLPAPFIKANQLTVWHSVPSVVHTMQRVRAGEAGFLRSLRTVILCGEPCRRSWVEYLLEYCSPDVTIYNAYGPTETTVFCLTERMRSDYSFHGSEPNVPLGRSLPGVELKLAARGESAEAELIISGPGVGSGYVHQSPGERNGYGWDDDTGIGRYSTGDLVEIVGNRLYFRGRADSQVKLRGNRFELEEIEALLTTIGAGSAYAVLAQDSVVLFLDDSCPMGDKRLRAELALQLPTYALPKKLIRLKTFPRNVNDKVDRRRLTELAVAELGAS